MYIYVYIYISLIPEWGRLHPLWAFLFLFLRLLCQADAAMLFSGQGGASLKSED